MTLASIALILGTLPLLFIPEILMLSELFFIVLFMVLLIMLFLLGKLGKFLALTIMFSYGLIGMELTSLTISIIYLQKQRY